MIKLPITSSHLPLMNKKTRQIVSKWVLEEALYEFSQWFTYSINFTHVKYTTYDKLRALQLLIYLEEDMFETSQIIQILLDYVLFSEEYSQ